jgi:hypothetical protein
MSGLKPPTYKTTKPMAAPRSANVVIRKIDGGVIGR